MEDSRARWKRILQTSEMRMLASRQTNSTVFDQMQQTQEAIRKSLETIRRTDELIRRTVPISR